MTFFLWAPDRTIKVCGFTIKVRGFTLKGAMARQEIAGMTFFLLRGVTKIVSHSRGFPPCVIPDFSCRGSRIIKCIWMPDRYIRPPTGTLGGDRICFWALDRTIKVCGFTLKGAMARQEIAGMTFFLSVGDPFLLVIPDFFCRGSRKINN
jgi:hypothetical protein